MDQIADKLCERIFIWLEQQERCVKQFKDLAQYLEHLRKRCNTSECVGSTLSVVGSTMGLMVAGLATLFTGGLAAPLLVASAAAVGAGAAVSIGTSICENCESSSIMKEAKNLAEEHERNGKEIQRLMQQLSQQREQRGSTAASSSSEGESYIVENILRAMARQHGVKWNAVYNQLSVKSIAQRRTNQGFSSQIQRAALATSIPVLHVFISELHHIWKVFGGKAGQTLISKGASAAGIQIAKGLSTEAIAGMKAATVGVAKVGGAALGLALSLPDMIIDWQEMVSNNHVTAASQSLRDAAKEMETATAQLRNELEKIQRMIKEMARVKRCIANIEYSLTPTQEGMQIVDYVKKNCPDQGVHSWLDSRSHSAQFLNLLSYFSRTLKDEIAKKVDQREDVDIVFCGHGSFMADIQYPAGCLTLLPTIKDVLLYSPWNCFVNARVVYGVATGAIQPGHRVFIPENHRPATLPPHWNSMHNAGTQLIPEIIFKPVGEEEGAWQDLLSFGTIIGRNRIFFPYVRPRGANPLFFPETPFFVITLALSVMLMVFTEVKATVHLAACLGREGSSPLTPGLFHHLEWQYACTTDNTVMSNLGDVPLNSPMYRAFRAMFG